MSEGNIKPAIDDRYWFEFSKKLVDDAIIKRNTAAAKLQNLAVWLWGIYTGFAAIGFTLSGKKLSLWLTLLVAAASATIIAIYWATTWVQMPKTVVFDYRSPTKIVAIYKELVEEKQRRLNIAIFLSVLAAILVSISLIVVSVPQSNKVSLPKLSPEISTTNSQSIFSLTTWLEPTNDVTIILYSDRNQEAEKKQNIFKTTDNGLLQLSIPLEDNFSPNTVVLEWVTSDGTRIKLSKKFELSDQ